MRYWGCIVIIFKLLLIKFVVIFILLGNSFFFIKDGNKFLKVINGKKFKLGYKYKLWFKLFKGLVI